MYQGRSAAVILLLLCWAPVQARAQERRTCPGFDLEEDGLRSAIEYLTDEQLAGRGTGTFGDACAAEYIAARLRGLGFQPGFGKDGFLQAVPLFGNRTQSNRGAGAFNVVAVLRGAKPEEGVILVGAHHDHLGQREGQDYFPGADDNASGVAALIAAAALLAESPPPSRTVVFVTFTGEEGAFLGSRHYLKEPVVPLEDTFLMLNLDMVGRLRDSPLQVSGIGGLPNQREEILDLLSTQAFPVVPVEETRRGSDHGQFVDAGIPALHFTTGPHADHHKPSDTIEKIDFDGLGSVAQLVADIVQILASDE